MNIVICDDEKLFLSSIEQKINTWAEKNGHTKAIITHGFTSSEDMSVENTLSPFRVKKYVLIFF